ncbi:MAG: hypothetical protein ACD_9C00113G0003, partial [uncultured bacterium]
PFESSSHPEYLTEQLEAGELLIPYVDEFLSDGAAHGLYARFSDVKTQMFGGEINDILGLKVKTDESITNVQQLKSIVDTQFAVFGTQVGALNAQLSAVGSQQIDHEARITTIESNMTTLGQQLAGLQATIAIPVDIAQLELNTQDIELIKMTLGMGMTGNPADIELLGKLKAQIIEGGKLVINVQDDTAKTIGQAEILKIAKDEDKNGIDDVNGSDGKTVFIQTTAIVEHSKVFITPKVATEQSLAVVELLPGEGFQVSVKNIVSDNVQFDWMMVEEAIR